MCSKSTNDSLTSACIMTAMYIYIMAECCFRTADPSKPSRRPRAGAAPPRGSCGYGSHRQGKAVHDPGGVHQVHRGPAWAASRSEARVLKFQLPSGGPLEALAGMRCSQPRAARVPRPSWPPAPSRTLSPPARTQSKHSIPPLRRHRQRKPCSAGPEIAHVLCNTASRAIGPAPRAQPCYRNTTPAP